MITIADLQTIRKLLIEFEADARRAGHELRRPWSFIRDLLKEREGLIAANSQLSKRVELHEDKRFHELIATVAHGEYKKFRAQARVTRAANRELFTEASKYRNFYRRVCSVIYRDEEYFQKLYDIKTEIRNVEEL